MQLKFDSYTDAPAGWGFSDLSLQFCDSTLIGDCDSKKQREETCGREVISKSDFSDTCNPTIISQGIESWYDDCGNGEWYSNSDVGCGSATEDITNGINWNTNDSECYIGNFAFPDNQRRKIFDMAHPKTLFSSSFSFFHVTSRPRNDAPKFVSRKCEKHKKSGSAI